MAIQAQMYPENLGLPLMGGSQDWFFMSNNNNHQNNFNNTNNNNNNMVFNGCGFNEFTCSYNNLQQKQQQFQFQQQQQQQQEQQVLLQLQQQYLLQSQNQQQRNNTSCANNNNNDGFVFLSSSKNCSSTTTASTTTTLGSDYNQMPVIFSPNFVADHLEKQRQEIDRLINLQNERMRLALQEQRKQQLSTIMGKLEAKATQLMRQKDEEIARATKRTFELEDIITKMEIENQEWQRLATENEAMVVSLNNTLEQIKEQACCTTTTSSSCSSNEVEDTESCCDFVVKNKRVKQEIEEKNGVVYCKVCKNEKSCILLLPCKHLCCCKGCEAFVDACPVCKSAKMASIEALIS